MESVACGLSIYDLGQADLVLCQLTQWQSHLKLSSSALRTMLQLTVLRTVRSVEERECYMLLLHAVGS